MLDVTVKTLDGQNRSFSIPEDTTVKQFKEKISSSINISAETQRLIFQGRVLHDDKLMKDYDVQGKVVHVVVRAPPSGSRPPGTPDNPQPNTTNPGGRDVNSVVVGSFTLPSDVLDANMVQNIAQDAIRSMGDMGRNARVSTRTSTDGSAVDVHIHLGPVQTGQATSEAQMRLNTARQMVRLATEALNQLENPGSASGSNEGTPRSSTPSQDTSRTEPAADSVPSTSDSPAAPSPMDTSEDPEVPSSSQAKSENQSNEASSDTGSTQTESGSSTASNESTESAPSSQSNEGTQSNGSQQPGARPGPVRPNISALGEVLAEVNELNRRLQPHMERFTEIVQADAELGQNEQRDAQRVCNTVSEAMHAVSHCYHALSDLMVDLSQARPRQLYVTLAIAHPHGAIIQQTIPVQAQIQIGGSPRLIRRQFGPNRATSAATDPISVPGSTAGTGTSTTTTASMGTSTGPLPTTTETGTQPATANESMAGAQHDGIMTDEDVDRIAEEMTAGLQNVIGPGMRQGNGTPESPYVFVEMGPDSMTVNSISAQVVTTTEQPGSGATPNTEGRAGTAPTQSQPGVQPPGPQGQPQAQGPGIQIGGLGGVPGMAGLPSNFIQDLVQQIVQQTGGQGQPQRMQINIGQGPPGGFLPGAIPVMGIPRPGMPLPMGLRMGLGPRLVRTSTPRNESGTQTTTSVGGAPANSGTQTSATPTTAFGTQTSTSSSTARPTPSSTSGTQTLGGIPRAAAFVVPGIPGMSGIGGPHGMNSVDPYLQCSSRHFLTRHARNVANPQNSDTALADMVSNLMSGLLTTAQPGQPGQGTAVSTGTTSTTSTTGPSTGPPGGSTGQPRPTAPTSGVRIGVPRANIQLGTPAGLAGMFPGQMPFIPGMRFRLGTPPIGVPRPPSGPQPAAAQPTAPRVSTGTTPGQQGAGTAGGAEPNYVQMLRDMLQSANQGQGNQSTSTTQSTGTTSSTSTDQNQNVQPDTGRQQPISDEAFTQLVSGITGYMTQAAMGQAPRQTISDFISGLGENYSVPQGEGFINDILSCVLSHLQITDLIQVFYGHPQSLNRVQGPLREFMSSRVLDRAAATPENLRERVQILVESMQPEIQDTVNSATPRPHIDFSATLNGFFNQQFVNVISLIMNSRDNDANFGQDLYACVRRLLAELLILCSRCLGGMDAVELLMSARLRNLTAGVNPFIQEWMGSMTSRQLSEFIPTITVTEGEVSYYIVYKTPGQPSSSTPKSSSSQTTSGKSAAGAGGGAKRDPSPLRAPSPKRVSKPTQNPKSAQQPMETSTPTLSPGASEIEIDSVKLSSPASVKGAASADTSKPVVEPDNQPSPSGAQAAGTEWQAVVPSEWVPVISRDVETQLTQAPQPPHSDIYLQGMPPKRRRLMTQDRPDLHNTAEALPESLKRAVAAAAVEPISSLENLTDEVTNDTDLHESFDTQVNSTLTQRLNSDKDYKPERFPNSEEYFHKTSDKKK